MTKIIFLDIDGVVLPVVESCVMIAPKGIFEDIVMPYDFDKDEYLSEWYSSKPERIDTQLAHHDIIKRIYKLAVENDCKIVFTTSWQWCYSREHIINEFEKSVPGFGKIVHENWGTICYRDEIQNIENKSRAAEIEVWCKHNNFNVFEDDYVIIDDLAISTFNEMMANENIEVLTEHLVQTVDIIGFSESDYETAIKVLNNGCYCTFVKY